MKRKGAENKNNPLRRPSAESEATLQDCPPTQASQQPWLDDSDGSMKLCICRRGRVLRKTDTAPNSQSLASPLCTGSSTDASTLKPNSAEYHNLLSRPRRSSTMPRELSRGSERTGRGKPDRSILRMCNAGRSGVAITDGMADEAYGEERRRYAKESGVEAETSWQAVGSLGQ